MPTTATDLQEATLTRHDEISPGVFVIGFVRTHGFIPGQAIKLGIDETQPPRIYSICSGTNDDELCVLFNIKESGFLTPRLARLRTGNKILVSAPYGSFLGTDEPAWWIATGTGIAPFRSMLRSGLGRNKRLVHGVRKLNQFYFSGEFAEALGDNFYRCCSSESMDGVQDGRVTKFVREQKLPLDQKYYVCGQAQMAVEVRDILIAKGISFENIITEIYF